MVMRVFAALLLLSVAAKAQDSLLVKAIAKEAGKNYDRINRSEWHLTRDLVVGDSGPAGTQVTYQYDKDVLIRIVCSGFNSLGSWGKEYYPINGELAFVYTTLEYFPDKTPPNTSVNWKNIPADEYRIYLRNGKLIGVKPTSWSGTAAKLLHEFENLLKWSK
jgi:hypothetical protein